MARCTATPAARARPTPSLGSRTGTHHAEQPDSAVLSRQGARIPTFSMKRSALCLWHTRPVSGTCLSTATLEPMSLGFHLISTHAVEARSCRRTVPRGSVGSWRSCGKQVYMADRSSNRSITMQPCKGGLAEAAWPCWRTLRGRAAQPVDWGIVCSARTG